MRPEYQRGKVIPLGLLIRLDRMRRDRRERRRRVLAVVGYCALLLALLTATVVIHVSRQPPQRSILWK